MILVANKKKTISRENEYYWVLIFIIITVTDYYVTTSRLFYSHGLSKKLNLYNNINLGLFRTIDQFEYLFKSLFFCFEPKIAISSAFSLALVWYE